MEYWNKVIGTTPESVEKEDLTNQGQFVRIANDKVYVEDKTWRLLIYVVLAGFFLLLGILFLGSKYTAIHEAVSPHFLV